MNVWHEGIASRGASEIGSCILQYCIKKSSNGVKEITAYSDSCGGQNSNLKMALMWTHIVQTTSLIEINHKFLISGHSYLPNDTDFGIIEKARPKSTQVYVPSQWYNIIATCHKSNPCRIPEVHAGLFKSV